MAKAKDNSLHWIIGVVLLITGILIIAALVVTYSQGEDVNANVNIDNDAPVIDSANAQVWQDPADNGTNSVLSGVGSAPGPTITHTLAGNTNIIVKVNVSDSNGWASQPTNISMRLIRTIDGGTNNNVPFTVPLTVDTTVIPKGGPTACSPVANVSSTERTFLCGANMKYSSDSTTAGSEIAPGLNYQGEHWRATFWASDGVVNTESYDDIHYEFPEQIGITIPTILDLGTIAPDAGPAAVAPVSVSNDGNQQIDLSAIATAAWSCTGSGVPLVSDIHIGPQGTDTNYAAMDPLNASAEAVTIHTDFDLTRFNNVDSPTPKNMNFRIATTESVGPGVCTLSSIALNAIKGF